MRPTPPPDTLGLSSQRPHGCKVRMQLPPPPRGLPTTSPLKPVLPPCPHCRRVAFPRPWGRKCQETQSFAGSFNLKLSLGQSSQGPECFRPSAAEDGLGGGDGGLENEGPLSRKQPPADPSGILRPWTLPVLGPGVCSPQPTRSLALWGPGKGNAESCREGLGSACTPSPRRAGASPALFYLQRPCTPSGLSGSSPSWVGMPPPRLTPAEEGDPRTTWAGLFPPGTLFSVPSTWPCAQKQKSCDITSGAGEATELRWGNRVVGCPLVLGEDGASHGQAGLPRSVEAHPHLAFPAHAAISLTHSHTHTHPRHPSHPTQPRLHLWGPRARSCLLLTDDRWRPVVL